MGLINDDIRATAKAAIDSMMAPPEEGGLGKHCRLIFDSQKTKCPNCGYDAANQKSNHHYRPGGPQPFPNGSLCPVCMGKGVLETPVTQPIVMLCNWTPKTWLPMPGLDPSNVNFQVPGGSVQTKGWIQDLPRVLQARKMVLDTPIEGQKRYIYLLDGEPISPSNILQGYYFLAVWKRAGG